MIESRPLSAICRILARNTASNALFLFLNQALGLCGYMVLMRLLNLPEYGVLMLVAVLIGHFTVLDLGLSTGLEKFIPEYRADGNEENIARAITVTTTLFLLIGLICSIFFYVIAVFDYTWILGVPKSMDVWSVFIAASIISLFYWPLQSFRSACRGFNLHHTVNKIRFSAQLVSLCAAAVAAYVAAPLYVVLICYLTPGIGAALAQWVLLGKVLDGARIKLDRECVRTFRAMFDYSIWVFLIRLSSQVTNRLDNVIVSVLLGVASVPIYYGAMRVLKLAVQVNSVLKSAVVPIASEVSLIHGPQKFASLGFRGLRMFNAVFSLVSLGIIVFAQPILLALGGEVLADQAVAVQLGIALLLPVAGRAFFNEMLIGSGQLIERQGHWAIATAAVYVAVLVVGTEYWSTTGAILAHPVVHVVMGIWWLQYIASQTELGVGRLLKAIALGQWPVWIGIGFFLLLSMTFSDNQIPIGYLVLLVIGGVAGTWVLGLDSSMRSSVSARLLFVKADPQRV